MAAVKVHRVSMAPVEYDIVEADDFDSDTEAEWPGTPCYFEQSPWSKPRLSTPRVGLRTSQVLFALDSPRSESSEGKAFPSTPSTCCPDESGSEYDSDDEAGRAPTPCLQWPDTPCFLEQGPWSQVRRMSLKRPSPIEAEPAAAQPMAVSTPQQAQQAQSALPVMPNMAMLYHMGMMAGMAAAKQRAQAQAPQEKGAEKAAKEPKPEAPAEKKAEKKEKGRPQPAPRDPSVPITELTLMVKNVPNEYMPDVLLSEFEEWRESIDFFYLPLDFKTNLNLGYAFVNFCDVEAAERFRAHFHSARLPLWQGSGKILEVSEARVQGKQTYVERFRNSSVMANGVLKEEYKPTLFAKGVAVKFPEPEGELPALGPRFRRQR